jgi:hypothetical protein
MASAKERELEKLIQKWQKRFGLQGWTLTFQLVPNLASDAYAHTDIDEFHARAKITMVDPAQQDKHALAWRSMEHLVIHELLHVRLEPTGVKDGTPEFLAQERGINKITEAFLALDDEED